ncbi:MAG: hypothetical protein AB2L22_13100 [Syntrophales bacterium]
MSLYPIHAMGIRAWCSNAVIDPEDLETVYFLSVCGYQATVKGIVANLLENYGITIEVGSAEHDLRRGDLGYKVLMKRLPSGLFHALVLPKPALLTHDEKNQNRFCLVLKAEEDILPLFFRHLDDKTDIPLDPSWAPWLWKTLRKQKGWISELTTLVGCYRGVLVDIHPTRLHDLISEAIRKKTPDVIRCLTQKGGNGNGSNHPS